MNKFDLLKSHVAAYTKKDGTVVAAHETAYQKHQELEKKTRAAAARAKSASEIAKLRPTQENHAEAARIHGQVSKYAGKLAGNLESNNDLGSPEDFELYSGGHASHAKKAAYHKMVADRPAPIHSAISTLTPHGEHEWSHSEGSSKITVGAHRALDSFDVLGDQGWQYVNDNEMSHPDGHRATIDDGTLTLHHAPLKKSEDSALDLIKSHVDAYTKKDGTVVQAHDDKRVAASKAPPISTHAAALAASSKPGDLDHEDNQIAAGYMKSGDHKALASHIKNLDTAARDHILDHVHPDHRDGLGFQQINMDRSQKKYAEKFPGKKPVPKGRGFPKQHTAESAKADSEKARAAMEKLKNEDKTKMGKTRKAVWDGMAQDVKHADSGGESAYESTHEYPGDAADDHMSHLQKNGFKYSHSSHLKKDGTEATNGAGSIHEHFYTHKDGSSAKVRHDHTGKVSMHVADDGRYSGDSE